jgi:CheY-like chemotaxis protein
MRHLRVLPARIYEIPRQYDSRTLGRRLTVILDTTQGFIPAITIQACSDRPRERANAYAPSEQGKSVLLRLRIRQADQLGKVRVLLADDHRQFLTIAENLLTPAFEIVGSVPDGQALFDVAKHVKPDVIVTDISMPILDGIEAIRQLSESGCAAKIIFLTAHSDADFVQTCLSNGALGYVLKSRIMSDLLPAIQEALVGRVFISPPSSNRERIAGA